MTEWNKTTLGEVVELGGGFIRTGPFGSQLHASDYVEEGIPCIMPTNLKDNRISLNEIARISPEDAERLSRYIVKEGDIVYSRRGDVTLKALVRKQDSGYFCGTGCLLVRPGDSVDSGFLVYYLSTSSSKNWILKQVVGATMPNLNTKILARYPLQLPSLRDQQKIASTLEALNSKIELNNRINAELEAMVKTIYDYWFVRFDFPISAAYAASVGQPELEGKPYKSSGGEMVWNGEIKREVPKGWENCSLSEIGDIIGGSTPSKAKKEYFTSGGSGIPWITPKDLSGRKGKRFISHGEFDVTEAGRKSASLKIMPKGTVLLSSRAPVGYMAIAREPVTTNQGFKSLVPKDGFSTEYVFLTVQLYLPAIIKKASGSTFAEISSSTLKTVEVASPPQDLIEKFTTTVAPMFAQQDVLEQENQELASLRDWLLPMLMNGQVKVGEAEAKAKEYVRAGELGIAAEERERYKINNRQPQINAAINPRQLN